MRRLRDISDPQGSTPPRWPSSHDAHEQRPTAPSDAVSVSRPLCLRGVTKRFGGTLAVDCVDLEIERAAVLALLGPNGAGKSTLIKLLAGVYPPDAGEILLGGQRLDVQRSRRPIAFIHQELGLVEGMTAAENVALARGYPRRFGLVDWRRTAEIAGEALAALSLHDIDPQAPAHSLSPADRALVAIARAFAGSADFIVLDEPTACLPEVDVARVFEAMRRLKARGVGMILVTHRLDEVFRVADRIAVMQDGRLPWVRRASETSMGELVRLIAGGAAPAAAARAAPRDEVVLSLRDVQAAGVGPLSLTVRASELVGLAGLGGAGQEVLGRALAGVVPLSGGEISLSGQRVALRSPRDALRHGIAFATSNRRGDSLALGLTAGENVFLNPSAHRSRRLGFLSSRVEQRRARTLMLRFGVNPPEPKREIGALSGGNQQKLVMARGLSTCGRLLILEEPTLGADVGARAEIHAHLHAELHRGISALVISSDFHEIGYGIGLSHLAAIALQVHLGLPWPAAIMAVLLGGAAIGLVNGLLVELAQVDPFVATLGTGTVLYALSNWYTGGRQIVGALPAGFIDAGAGALGGVPVVALYLLATALLLFVVFEYLPIGRCLYAIAISAGDGSESAFARIRAGEYQIATVAEPLNLQGWQAVDELNRAIAGAPWSGYVIPVHLVTRENIASGGGPKATIYDPPNGYRDEYRKI